MTQDESIAQYAKHMRVLEDQGFQDWQVKHIPPYHIRDGIEYLLANKVKHDLKTLAWLVHDLVLILHAAPAYDQDFYDDDYRPFRRVGSMTGMVGIDKGARRVLKASGLLKRVQGYLECGRPYGTGLVCTEQGHRNADALVKSDRTLARFYVPELECDRLVDESLDMARKFATHFCAVLYSEISPVVVLNKPRDLTVMFGLPEHMAPLVSAGLTKLADMGQVAKLGGRFRRLACSTPSPIYDIDWRGGSGARFEGAEA